MDHIQDFDIQLEKECYYPGERLSGNVLISNKDNIKVRGVRVTLRGKVHVEWKVTRSGERRTVKEDQYLIDDKQVIWGKDKHEAGTAPILPRGSHELAFHFDLPRCSLPCSFESRTGTIRYYLRVVVDIPYASPPQGLKYFTIIAPHVDVMDPQYLTHVSQTARYSRCCWCCTRGPITLTATLERSAYCCGEHVRLSCSVRNQSTAKAAVHCALIQYVEYRLAKGALGLSKESKHTVFEHTSPWVQSGTSRSLDLSQHLSIPAVPPTLTGVSRLIDIYYVIKVAINTDIYGTVVDTQFPVDLVTTPYRSAGDQTPTITFRPCCDHVEGGLYISPEFQLGQVYDGTTDTEEAVILYRPEYVTVLPNRANDNHSNDVIESANEDTEDIT